MTIKAILRNGLIEPIEPLPKDWADGQELLIEDPDAPRTAPEITQWAKDLDTTTAQLPTTEHDRFRHALDEIERESKESVQREWGLQ